MSNPTPEKSPKEIADECLFDSWDCKPPSVQMRNVIAAIRVEREKRNALWFVVSAARNVLLSRTLHEQHFPADFKNKLDALSAVFVKYDAVLRDSIEEREKPL